MKHCLMLNKAWRGFTRVANTYHSNTCVSQMNTLHKNCRHFSTVLPQQTGKDPSPILHKEKRQLITDPLQHPDFFGIKNLVTMKKLFFSRVYFGHKKGSRNEHMQPYLYGNRLGVDIFDLDQTLEHMHRALNFVAHIAYLKGIILFIMRSQQHGHAVELAAKACGEYAHTREWQQGLLLNMGQKHRSVRLPDICIFLSLQDVMNQEHPAVAECGKLKIATVGIVDSNVNPTMITYPVPGNDDSPESVGLYLQLFQLAIQSGKQKRIEADQQKQDVSQLK
uniref:Small ribosomal subunit protein uS2m n=1 Tax=Ciona intestinalis TaxID=7719 RepID=F6WCB0_CIOIN|nr:28S ribosomal protein S2, mitochondrial-like [Ciona intestinalis]|eukprot:XP_002126843.1 28S ribosomal protein S2, mitochondrial-like [Ciona intestinalis]